MQPKTKEPFLSLAIPSRQRRSILVATATGGVPASFMTSLSSSSSAAAAAATTTSASPSTDTADLTKNGYNNKDMELCHLGLLVPESPIPGAYQNICMNLEERVIPLTQSTPMSMITTTTTTTTTTTICDTTTRTFTTGSFHPIVVQQRGANMGAGRTGMAVWNSALLLTRLLVILSTRPKRIPKSSSSLAATTTATATATETSTSTPCNPSLSWIQNQTILELGCGTGLTSIVCAKVLGAAHVIATDGNPAVVQLARENIHRNTISTIETDGIATTTATTMSHQSSKDKQWQEHVQQQQQQKASSSSSSSSIETIQLSWGLLDAMEYSEVADLVIGSDLTYNSGSWRVLSETIDTVLKPHGGTLLYVTLGHSGFNVDGEMNGFVQVLSSTGTSNLVVDAKLARELEQELLHTLTREEHEIVNSTGGIRVLVAYKV